jgi:radical SAM superfamily enzyme YgiQ (UPF0313 family)
MLFRFKLKTGRHILMQKKKQDEPYSGFEQGPIRPPSEAESLLVRITRNCPWNHCTFCPVYKGKTFSLRPIEHVIRDIDAVHHYTSVIRDATKKKGALSRPAMRRLFDKTTVKDPVAFQAAVMWASRGMRSIFLQDANSLIIKPRNLIEILSHLKHCFPWVERITSYARSHTIARISDENLKAMKNAGLNRIHIGLESGADQVLERIAKGVTKEQHIKAGIKVKAAGMELSEYVMPGLGGRDLSAVHAAETAYVINRINPDFIRLRSLAIPNHVSLYEDMKNGRFEKLNDFETAKEILSFIEKLDGITGTLKSDHILNLFEEIEGTFPEDKDAMAGVIYEFLALPSRIRCIYQVGRRLGIVSRLSDIKNPSLYRETENACEEMGVTPENIDALIDNLMKRFV